MNISDLANDDDFGSAWWSHPLVKEPWWEVDLQEPQRISMVTITEADNPRLKAYRLEYAIEGRWATLYEGKSPNDLRVKVHRFPTVLADRVRITVLRSDGNPGIAEVGVY